MVSCSSVLHGRCSNAALASQQLVVIVWGSVLPELYWDTSQHAVLKLLHAFSHGFEILGLAYYYGCLKHWFVSFVLI